MKGSVICVSYNSCRTNQSENSVLKYTPNHKHMLTKTFVPLLSNMKKSVVYLTLENGEGFWFYIEECGDIQISGFKKENEIWVYLVISLANIHSFC